MSGNSRWSGDGNCLASSNRPLWPWMAEAAVSTRSTSAGWKSARTTSVAAGASSTGAGGGRDVGGDDRRGGWREQHGVAGRQIRLEAERTGGEEKLGEEREPLRVGLSTGKLSSPTPGVASISVTAGDPGAA